MGRKSKFIFGRSSEYKNFNKEYKRFIECLPNLRKAQDLVLSAATMPRGEANIVIYFLARQVFEDFNEILLLCANGFSTGAMKILRGMFERSVAAAYLQKNPMEATAYRNYIHIRNYKEMQVINEHFPGMLEEVITKEEIEQVERAYRESKSLYLIPVCDRCKNPDCKECKKTRVNLTWTKKNLITMATEVEGFDIMIYPAYYIPMQETHSTERAMLTRFKLTEGGRSYEYDEGRKPDVERVALLASHYLTYRMLSVFADQFDLQMEEILDLCWKDMEGIWGI